MPKPSPVVLLCICVMLVVSQAMLREQAHRKFVSDTQLQVNRLDRRCDTIEKNMRTSVIHPRFFKHCLDCQQCGTPSPESSLCEEGFELLKSDLREGKK